MPSADASASAPRSCSTANKTLCPAVDTNVLLDWADGTADVLDALSTIAARLPGTDKLVPPSALDELAFLCDSDDTDAVRRSARRAIRMLREQNHFRPLLDLPVPETAVETVARELRRRGLLPDEEVHDSLIRAEAAYLGCARSIWLLPSLPRPAKSSANSSGRFPCHADYPSHGEAA